MEDGDNWEPGFREKWTTDPFTVDSLGYSITPLLRYCHGNYVMGIYEVHSN